MARWPGAELNRRHRGFQPRALPPELPGPKKTRPNQFGGRAWQGLSPHLAAVPSRPFRLTRPGIPHRPAPGQRRVASQLTDFNLWTIQLRHLVWHSLVFQAPFEVLSDRFQKENAASGGASKQ